MDKLLVEKFKKIYLDNSNKTTRDIAIDLGISNEQLKEIMQILKISNKRKRHYVLNESYFHEIDSANKAYFLGLIAADGFVEKNNFVLCSKDIEILELFIKELEIEGLSICRSDGHYENSKECYAIRLSSQELVADLNSHGIFYKKSLCYNAVPNISEKFLWDYLRGYIDGDGSASFSYRTYRIKNKDYTYPRLDIKIIATQKFIKNVAKKFCIKNYSIYESHTKGMFYMVISNKKELLRMYPLLYNANSNAFFQRKKAKWDKYMCALNQK